MLMSDIFEKLSIGVTPKLQKTIMRYNPMSLNENSFDMTFINYTGVDLNMTGKGEARGTAGGKSWGRSWGQTWWQS